MKKYKINWRKVSKLKPNAKLEFAVKMLEIQYEHINAELIESMPHYLQEVFEKAN